MMMNLFSIFDPTSTLLPKLNLNWSSTLMMLILLPKTFWLILPRKNILMNNLMLSMHNEIKILMSNFKINSTLMYVSLFFFILYNNFMGLFPYIFTSTSHLTTSLALSIPMWIMMMLFGWMKNMNHMFTHLVPQNTPNMLMPFMVMIESISNFIRPLTLAVRLTANIIAGHLLMTLMSSISTKISMISSLLLVLTQISLLILEYAVSIIQSYVFMVLITLYSSELK
uniref:ATP synthase F0 subunit 6 n=1 Tax=Gilpinia tabulaeformis TaxID=2982312 RepID=UPI0023F0FC2D|nr:ATP synthase F0 subunit 6 [Gilpinia tabulaeformis]WDY84709.1 ATP synthase F0 subunit 6 [Gilpinia tabulaeformis]